MVVGRVEKNGYNGQQEQRRCIFCQARGVFVPSTNSRRPTMPYTCIGFHWKRRFQNPPTTLVAEERT
jgi:hypothetical protein